jgi:hypothetical protein
MATRVGIELSPTACRIVEMDGGNPWQHGQGDIRVRSFSVLPPSGPETRRRLESLKWHSAAVVVWGGRSEHRQVMVTAGSYEAMRAEAMTALAVAGLETNGVWADIAQATPPGDQASRRPVVVSMASASELADLLQPLRDAGLRVRAVTTPAVALSSLARMRRLSAVPGAIESWVALEERSSCIALIQGGVLLAARELPWGFVDADYARSGARSREEITTQLAEAIGDFVAAIGQSTRDIGQVCLCGGLPELRNMAVSLMDRLDVEVEPLDSLFGIDAAHLPEADDEFRERSAELRLAWAAAADWPPPINLLRARRRRVSKAWLARAAVVAGAAAGVGGSWWVVERMSSGPAPASRSAANGQQVALPVVAGPPVQAEAPVVMPPLPEARPAVDAPPPVLVEGAPVAAKPTPSPARARPAAPPEVALPFDAELGTILFSDDRKLAIIDNRIVEVGDEVRGARVVEITARGVMLRDDQGRLRRLTLDAGGR